MLAPEPADPRRDGDRRESGRHQEAHAALHREYKPPHEGLGPGLVGRVKVSGV